MLQGSGLTRDVMERARRSRDARFDGKFFIAVTSTRIYCRSICPARTSKDTNVRYYATAAEAAAAGYRPCLRCRPESAPGSPAWLGTSAVVRRALRLIQAGALDQDSVEALALRLGVGPRHLSRLFARHVGATPVAIAQTRRLHFAKQLLDETRLPITQIALASGFGSLRRFNQTFKTTYRRTPREIRKTGRGGLVDATIRLRLAYRPPYDWDQVLGFLCSEAIPGVEHVDATTYRRTVENSTSAAVIEVERARGQDALELRIRGGESSDLLPIASAVRRMFDLTADPAKIGEVLGRDPLLCASTRAQPGLRVVGAWSAFESVVRGILAADADMGADTRAAGANSVLAQLVNRCGTRLAGTDELGILFPTPEALATAELDDLGLSPGARAALRELAMLARTWPRSPADPDLGALPRLARVGTWVAGYTALRGLGDPDALPDNDPRILRALAARPQRPGMSGMSGDAIGAYAERWRPFRSYAVFHLWETARRST